MKSSLHLLALCGALLAGLATPLDAQHLRGTTHECWSLDGGGSPSIRVLRPDGAAARTISLPGSGNGRSLSCAADGTAWIARGMDLHQIDGSGTLLATIPRPMGAGEAQDVIPLPDGRILGSYGLTAADSRLVVFDPVAMTTTPISDMLLEQPRSLAVNPLPGTNIAYIANRDAGNILALDTASLTLSVLSTLGSTGIGPVSVAFDRVADGVWVAGGWGQTAAIVFVSSSGATSRRIDYPPSGAPGLLAPGGMIVDRYRRLYVAGGDRNGGTAGIYVFDTTDPGVAPPFLVAWPDSGSAGSNPRDVAMAAEMAEICPPTENGVAVVARGRRNRFRIAAPERAGMPYWAGLSFQWSLTCEPLPPPGILSPLLRFAPLHAADVRGIPLVDDDLGLLANTLGLPDMGTPSIGPLILSGWPRPYADLDPFVNDFEGMLDANGEAIIQIDFRFLPPGIFADGFPLSLGFLTFDDTYGSDVGLCADPICLTFRDPVAQPLNGYTPCN